MATICVNKLSLNTNMSRSRTIGTIFASLAIGALAFFVTSPKKVHKKKESSVSESQEENAKDQEDLFI